MRTIWALFVFDVFLFMLRRAFILSLSEENQASVIEALNATNLYLQSMLHIDCIYFEEIIDTSYLDVLDDRGTRMIESCTTVHRIGK